MEDKTSKQDKATPTPEEEAIVTTEKKPYTTPVLKNFGKLKDLTAAGSRFCPNGKPKPPTGNCGHN